MRTAAQAATLFATVALAVGQAPVTLAYTGVATNDAGARVVLQQVLEQRTRPLFAAVADPGQPFGRSAAISPAYYFTEQQAVVDPTGGMVAAWKRMDPQGTDFGQVVAAIRAPSGGFGRPVQLSSDNKAEAVTLAGSPRGDAIVAWTRYQRPVEYSFRAAGGRFGPATEIAGSTFSYAPVARRARAAGDPRRNGLQSHVRTRQTLVSPMGNMNVVSAYAAVAEPHRRQILDLLRDGERHAGELVERLELSQPGVSKHLKVLREAGLVAVRADGRRRLYALRPEPLAEVDRWLEPYRALWSKRLDALERHLEENP
jgi:DNA-binding transcriptional ArsR family regulator